MSSEKWPHSQWNALLDTSVCNLMFSSCEDNKSHFSTQREVLHSPLETAPCLHFIWGLRESEEQYYTGAGGWLCSWLLYLAGLSSFLFWSSHVYNNASCQQITQSSCLFRENTNCSAVLCRSEGESLNPGVYSVPANWRCKWGRCCTWLDSWSQPAPRRPSVGQRHRGQAEHRESENQDWFVNCQDVDSHRGKESSGVSVYCELIFFLFVLFLNRRANLLIEGLIMFSGDWKAAIPAVWMSEPDW